MKIKYYKLNSIRKLTIGICLSLCCLNMSAEDRDTTVVIPSTGHLAIKPSGNFTGPAGVIVSNFYGSGNISSPGLRFNNQELGEEVVIAHSASSNSGLILTATPGSYTLTFTDREATKQFFSTSAYWAAESGTVTQKDRFVYKFVNTEGHVGFECDEKYASEQYQSCDLEEGEHLYLPVSEKMMERLTVTLETTADNLKFIPWSELWDCPSAAPTGINNIKANIQTGNQTYDLTGHKATANQRGLLINNGKKYIAK